MHYQQHRSPTRVRTIAIWGITWGLAISVTEWLSFSNIEVWDSGELVLFWLTGWMLPLWCLIGCVFVWVADRVGPIAGTRGLIAGWISVAIVSAAVHPLIMLGVQQLAGNSYPRINSFAWGAGAQAPALSKWIWLSLYDLWVTAFYGGLLVTGYVLSTRAERTRLALHTTAMARSQTEALLDQTRLEVLQGQIDPSLLLESMRELELRYLARSDRAERLLEALVEFLRCAMPGLREGDSTLESELRLATAYARLQHERGVAGAWSIDAAAGAAAAIPFPSLFMLPLLALAGDGSPSVRTDSVDGRTTLWFSGLQRRVTDEFERRLRARLQALYGEHFTIDRPASADTQLVITMKPAAPAAAM